MTNSRAWLFSVFLYFPFTLAHLATIRCNSVQFIFKLLFTVGVYFEEVDHWGHLTGPTGENVSNIIRQVDAQLERILGRLEAEEFPSDGKKLSERVNVVIFSDHGMTLLIDRRDGIVRFDASLVKPGDVLMGSKFGPVLQVYTSEDNVDVVRPSID